MVALLVWSGSLACAPEPAPLELLAFPVGTAPLNASLEFLFDAALDALSVEGRSVRVTDGEGRPLSAVFEVRGDRLRVRLRIDAERLADPPERIQVSLAGAPSLHAVRSATGAPLDATRTLEVVPSDELGAGLGRVRLASINGRPRIDREQVSHAGEVHLAFEGVPDPATLTPLAWPLYPVAEGLQLKPVQPAVRWSLVGTRCDVVLRLPPEVGTLELVWKRIGLRGLDGKPVEGPLVVTLSGS